MRYYGGIDLHSTNSVVVVTDESDRIAFKERLRNELGPIIAVLAPFGAVLRGVVVESTYNWYWLVDGLQEAGFRVHLANTVALKRYSGLKHTNDGAAWLAHLLRLGCWRRAISARAGRVGRGTFCAAAASWSATRLPTYWRSRTR